MEAELLAATQSEDFKKNSLVKGLTFNSIGRTVAPGIVTMFDDNGVMVAAP